MFESETTDLMATLSANSSMIEQSTSHENSIIISIILSTDTFITTTWYEHLCPGNPLKMI